MGENNLDSMLDYTEHNQRELAVRRYLHDFIDVLEEKLDERSDRAVGSLPFNPSKLGDSNMTNKYGRVAYFLKENTNYVKKHTNYSIDPEKLNDLRREAESIKTLPTTEEEQDIIVSILEGKKLNHSELKEELYERLEYEPTDKMIDQRIDMVESIEIDEEKRYKLKE